MNERVNPDAYGVLTEPATLTIQRMLPGPIERVWAYLTESDLRRKWLAAGEMEMKVGAPFEHVQPIAPEALVEREPLMGAGKRAGIEPADMGAPAHLAAHQPGTLQRLDVLGGGLQGDGEGLCELADRALAGGEIAQHLPPRGVAQGVEDGVELPDQRFNHMVEYGLRRPIVNDLVED